MVGSAVVRCLQDAGFGNLMRRTSQELDLTDQSAVDRLFKTEKPDYVFLAAARVGGIMANKTYRAEFIYRNLQIQNNVIHGAWKAGVRRLFFFSSSCVYPRSCLQPMKEEHLWQGPLEQTNEPYAVAKLAGMSMCRAYNDEYGTTFISGIPTKSLRPERQLRSSTITRHGGADSQVSHGKDGKPHAGHLVGNGFAATGVDVR